jgi:putative two-component system response regulator
MRMQNDPESTPRDRLPTVLVAEDHNDSRCALVALLEAFGYRVIEAANGLEAVELASSGRPDLILMDIMMPELDGFEAIRRVRLLDQTRSIPIIAVTAMEGAEQLALQAGADAYVGKPIESRLLMMKIRELIRN